MKKNERFDAFTILSSLLQQRTPLSYLLQGKTSFTPLTKEICFGVTRHYIRLEALANCLLNKRPKDISVWLCILIGLYQLHCLNIPDYAVVKETVALLDQLKKPWAKALVNAILRRYCREKESLLQTLSQHNAFIYGHSDWLIHRIQTSWPDNWQAILTANDCHPPMSLRVNQAKISATDYLAALETHGIQGSQCTFAPNSIRLKTPIAVYDLPGFSTGEVSVQDSAAQLAAPLLDVKPHQRVLDACCAPGGKTCHLLEIEPTLSLLALDIESTRLERVQENLTRLNLHATLQQGDALTPETWWNGRLFDRILLDAPCSATGVIRRHPDIKLLRTPQDIETIVQVQQQILAALWPLLAPGGRLVYATCSIMPEENEKQIARFIEQHPDCHHITTSQPWGHSTGHGWQILPGEHDMDGFFYSVLQKQNDLGD